MNAQEKLKKALISLGVTGKVKSKAVTDRPGETRCTVWVNGEPFGVFDIERETFVD